MKAARFLILIFISLIFNVAQAQINYAHFIQQARLDLTEGRFKEGISGLNVAIAAKPENFEGYFLRGLAKFSLEDFTGAITDFDKTLEIHPMYVRALQYRAVCNDRLGNLDEALTDFRRAIDLDPFDADLFFARGITYLHLNRYQAAIDDYDMVLTIDNKMSL
ncbi:MAG: tetratricopeptide repeat protein, partial [bacterium]|nr:tetratricopeptide repeat protein [Candidatus Limimorpha equi]